MRLGSAFVTLSILLLTAALGRTSSAGTAASAPVPASTGRQTVLATPHKVSNTARTTRRWSGALDPGSKTQVTHAFFADYVPAGTVAPHSSGNPNTCKPGTTSAAYRAATIGAVNFMRDLAGLAPVSQATSEAAPAQAAALIMAANHSLSHSPPSNWRCWTKPGHDGAGRSNLAYGFITAGSTIRGYMSEPGASNLEVGHRRWILNPFGRRMGVGAVQDAEALTVINGFDTSRPNPAYVGWPTSGWFPYPLEPDQRWSLSAGDSRTRFGHARVTVLDGSTPVAVRREAPVYGYGQPTLVWEMPPVHNGHTYSVRVTGMTRSGVKGTFSTSYKTHLFTPVNATAPLKSSAPAPTTRIPVAVQPSSAGSTTTSCFLLVLCSSG